MKVALFTGVYRDEPFERTAAEAARIGYDGLEIRALSHLPPDSGLKTAKELRRIADAYGLEIPVLYSNINGAYVRSTDEEAAAKIELLRRYAERAAVLGAGMICHVPGGPVPQEATDGDYAKAARWLRKAAEAVAETAGIKLVLEIHHGGLLETVESTLRLIREAGHDAIGAVLDPGNMAIAGEDYGPAAVARLGDRLFHVHAKDVRLHTESEAAAWPRRVHRYGDTLFSVELMGEGHVDHAPVYRALAASGYGGYVSLEAQVDGVAPERIAQHELEAWKRALGRIGPASDAPAGRGRQRE